MGRRKAKYKEDSAPGYDGLFSKVINPVIEALVPPLTYITNLYQTEGFFPLR